MFERLFLIMMSEDATRHLLLNFPCYLSNLKTSAFKRLFLGTLRFIPFLVFCNTGAPVSVTFFIVSLLMSFYSERTGLGTLLI